MTTKTRVEELLSRMTLAEKLGQMWQVADTTDANKELVRRGAVGSCLNVKGADAAEFQRIAREESRLGIPLIIGLDVIHGYSTVMPIPLGQAASFNPSVARDGARVAALEAAAEGINWTFTPMVDISRDPRWGRIAESCGEDTYLSGRMGAAMVEGFQGSPVCTDSTGVGTASASRKKARWNLAHPGSIAACVKHYVGYGAAEGGRDYNTTLIPERTLRNVYLPPFKACIDAGVCTLMSGFNELNDIPTSGNSFTLRQVLKKEWRFDGFVVSDWTSIAEMIMHGYCADGREAAHKGIRAGVDMEMVSDCYFSNAEALLASGQLKIEWIDDAVRRILRIKFELGLFDRPITPEIPKSVHLRHDHLQVAYHAALESCVLLKNSGVLPLSATGKRIAVIGPLADDGLEQLGCWVVERDGSASQTPLMALRQTLGTDTVLVAPGLSSPRDTSTTGFADALTAARAADCVLMFLGEDAGLSGEAHSRSNLNLPGAQVELIAQIRAAVPEMPLVAVVMAGRPLVLTPWLEQVDALLWAWHPGTMGGPAIVDLLLGKAEPSGRLPVSFPRSTGHIPVYYNHKNTGRPPLNGQWAPPEGTPQNPRDFTSRYMDANFTPQFNFGFGLSYTTFAYSAITLSSTTMKVGETLSVQATVTNTGNRTGVTVPQLYVRDAVASANRPIRELKGFQKIALAPDESRVVSFTVGPEELAFWNGDMKFVVEPGIFQLWIAADSRCLEHEPAQIEVTP